MAEGVRAMHVRGPGRTLGGEPLWRAVVLLAGLLLCGASTVGGALADVERAAVPTCRGMAATIVGTAGDDTLNGTAADDVIVGGGGLDVILGGSGDDMICGGSTRVEEHDGESEYQTIDGGAGDDIVVGGDGVDYIDGSVGADLLIGHGGLDSLYGGAGEDTLRGGPGDDQLSGDRGTDRVFGDDGNDRFEDSDGANLLEGGDGSDVFASGPGNDTIRGDGGRDTVSYVATLQSDGWSTHCHDVVANLKVGSSHGIGFGTDVLSGVENVWTGGGNDVLVGDDSDNEFYTGNPWGCREGRSRVESVTGNGGVDEISFDSSTAEDSSAPGPVQVDLTAQTARWRDRGPGPAVVLTLRGIEDVTGTEFRDIIVGDEHSNRLVGAFGISDPDVIRGGSGADRLYGGDRNDLLDGGPGADTLYGRSGNDRLLGGSGNDRLSGGLGRNRNNGGSGTDTCRQPNRGRLAISCER